MRDTLETTETVQKKMEKLNSILCEMDSIIVAYSGGVDSAFLAISAKQTLGNKALAVTAKSPSLAPSELTKAVELAQEFGLNHKIIETNEVEREDYKANDANRCYFCKDELYTHLSLFASKEGYNVIANGTNIDDLGDFRPGLNAAEQYGIRSPMVEAGLTKAEIRTLSKKMSIPVWDKPAQACLSSRIPYGTPVSVTALNQIAEAEDFLRELGIDQLRVRHHDTIARIEVHPADFFRLVDEDMNRIIVNKFKDIGYSYITLDLEGFRSGSLNEVLAELKKTQTATQKT